MKANLYKIECLTNMHVGSGEVNYNIIDNEVEKDYVLGTPTINSSGVKGALRQHFKNTLGTDKALIESIFGSERNGMNFEEGAYKFLSAQLISRPLRVSNGPDSYVNVTTDETMNNFIGLLKNFNIEEIKGFAIGEKFEKPANEKKPFAVANKEILQIEGFDTVLFQDVDNKRKLLDILIDKNYAVCSSNTMKGFDLPVMARNVLKNGKSDNLWYEEIVPHKSIFYFIVLTPEDDKNLSKFDELLESNYVMQFGANASIGYGYTKVTKVV